MKPNATAGVFSDRIIAGYLKGRVLVLPKSEGVRPSKNRVKQAVFNMLTARVDWDGMVVGDLFCGSGAWGIEAVSRGAQQVFCVDIDERTVKQNIQGLKGEGMQGLTEGQAVAVSADVRLWKPPALLDVVLADPPYGKGLAQALVLRAADIGKSGSWWCVEAGRDDEIVWDGFEKVEFRDYGGSRVWVAQRV